MLKDALKILETKKILLEENDIFNYLKINKRWPYRYAWGQPSIEILSNVDDLKMDKYFFNVRGEFQFERWKELYDLGYTAIISNVLDLNNDLREIHKTLLNEVGLDVSGNFYFSKVGQKPSFESHNHDYTVIVKQIYGDSDWEVGNQKFTMKPQNVCCIPKGVNHRVLSKKNNKLSLTINLEP